MKLSWKEVTMKRIGIGYENYKDFIDKKLYYVDKTLLIRDVIEKGGQVTLFTRPRRFGKTLALSMLRTFFEAERDSHGNPMDNRRYFDGMKIMDCGEEYTSMLGQYPVIKLTLKSAKQPIFYTAFMKLRDEILDEYERHAYVLESDRLPKKKKAEFNALYNAAEEWEKRKRSLRAGRKKRRRLRKRWAALPPP